MHWAGAPTSGTKLCLNGLEVTGREAHVHAFCERAAAAEPPGGEASPSVLAFHRLVPLPPPALVAALAPREAAPDEVAAWRSGGGDLVRAEAVARLRGWQAEEAMWGVRGGAVNPRVVAREPGRVTYTFETQDRPPILLLRRVSSAFPALLILLAYVAGDASRGLVTATGGRARREVLLDHEGVSLDEADCDDETAHYARLMAHEDHVWALVRPAPGR